ncbi:hypothetical protein GTS_31970 [Gandjariella thermophila]|uniref:Uncharacterized protein n=1 Tax=Gandjariella thermophila TaxID=1931992 RepID=A0A4D4J7S6_9PSEU|nr:hypothetical protein GTS_31970 [Gandjariella thermophila]
MATVAAALAVETVAGFALAAGLTIWARTRLARGATTTEEPRES